MASNNALHSDGLAFGEASLAALGAGERGRYTAMMIRHLLTAALLFAGQASATTVICEPITSPIVEVSFTRLGNKEDIALVAPKDFKGATLVGLSVVYGHPKRLQVPLDSWPGDDGEMEAHFEVASGHEELIVRASYRQGACLKNHETTIKAWETRHK